MTDKDKDKVISEVMKGFDFEKAHAVAVLTKKGVQVVPGIKEFKEQAEKLLRMALEHQDREFWWAGGLGYGGLCACYDRLWGLTLNYVAFAKRVRISRIIGYDKK